MTIYRSHKATLVAAVLTVPLLWSACGDDSAGTTVSRVMADSGDSTVDALASPDDTDAREPADTSPASDILRSDADARDTDQAVDDTAQPDTSQPDVSPDAPPRALRFDEVTFRATHNSYSGHARGTIEAQLDLGVRFIEFDLHDNDYLTHGDYRVGHTSPGNEVDRTGTNPGDDLARSWLQLVADWSDAHPGHAPITLGIDLKDNLTDNPTAAAGNMAALNELLRDVFGAKVFAASDLGDAPWPDVAELRDRVLFVMTGDWTNRERYLSDTGNNPAVAMNDRGQIVEVHEGGLGRLYYWTGEYHDDGSIAWRRHGRYDSGGSPSVAINTDGWIVEVHQATLGNNLHHRVGRLGADFEIGWFDSVQYDTGAMPTIEFTDATTVREIHRATLGNQNWTRVGSLDGATGVITWGAAEATVQQRYDRTSVTAGGRSLSVSSEGGGLGQGILVATGAGASPNRIRYEQVVFVDLQNIGPAALLDEPLRFGSAGVPDKAWATARQAEGLVVRVWSFNDPSAATDPLVNFPATDTPFEPWYLELTADAVR